MDDVLSERVARCIPHSAVAISAERTAALVSENATLKAHAEKVAALDVELTPEIRGVFDRLLDAGATIIVIDHVSKQDDRSGVKRYAIGSVSKLGLVDYSYTIEPGDLRVARGRLPLGGGRFGYAWCSNAEALPC